ncbi:MAG: helix-turn-helix domain-containing protein [Patescibacteria group bacterium]
MKLRGILQSIGLSEKQADVYLACLKYGPESISNIAHFAGYKRTTLYGILETMKEKGFIITMMRNKRLCYDATPPSALIQILKTQHDDLKSVLPELEQVQGKKDIIPNVQIHEGDATIKQLYLEIFDRIPLGKPVDFLTSITQFQDQFPIVLEAYDKILKETDNPKWVRELVFDDERGRKFVKHLRSKKNKPQTRLLPTDFPIHNEIIIFDNNVVFLSLGHRNIATVITNPEVQKTIKSLYEWAWLSARK